MFCIFSDRPPIIAFGFKNPKIGSDIFSEIKDVIGSDDSSNKLRLSIITGTQKENIFSYKVLIGPNENYIKEHVDAFSGRTPESTDLVVNVTRISEMTPSSSVNLDGFIESFKKFGCYYITNSKIPIDDSDVKSISFFTNSLPLEESVNLDNLIKKNELIVKKYEDLLIESPKSLDFCAVGGFLSRRKTSKNVDKDRKKKKAKMEKNARKKGRRN